MTLPACIYIREWRNDARSVHDEPDPDTGRVLYVRADAFILTPKLPTSEADEAIVDALVQANRPKATDRIRTPRLTAEGFVECDLCGYESRPEKLACEFCGQYFPSALASAEAYDPEKAK